MLQVRRELAEQKEKVQHLKAELARAKSKVAEAVVEVRKAKMREVEVLGPGCDKTVCESSRLFPR